MDDTAAMRKLAQMMLIICVRCVTFLARYCDHNEAAVFPLLSGGWCDVRAGEPVLGVRPTVVTVTAPPVARTMLWTLVMGHGRSYHVSVVCNEGTNK